MIIAVSQRNMKMDKRANRDALENTYIDYFEKFGVMLLPIPNVSKNLNKYFDNIPIKAIILSSGNDVNPKLYGKKPQNEDISEDRDNTEKSLIEISIKKKLPLFGICRGTQFINVYFGGSLVQKLKDKTGFNHVAVPHSVKIVDEETVKFFKTKEFVVNSYHNQGITEETLSSKLRAFAISKDGSIEGIYHPKYPIAGVMWHPERQGSDKEADKKLIKAFLNRKLFWKKK